MSDEPYLGERTTIELPQITWLRWFDETDGLIHEVSTGPRISHRVRCRSEALITYPLFTERALTCMTCIVLHDESLMFFHQTIGLSMINMDALKKIDLFPDKKEEPSE